MPRYKITVEYDGRKFVGWQRQETGLGVQEVLEKSLADFTRETPTVFCAGRTDAGVHARGQVAHFDLDREWDTYKLFSAINMHIRPHAVSVLDAVVCQDDFHARFDALQRSYMYRVINRRAPLALEKGLCWKVPVDLDIAAMAEAANHLIGHHDFTSFRSSKCQSKSPHKTIDDIRVEKIDAEIRFHVSARSFLHHQVRNFVGTLIYVGQGKWRPDDVKLALEACDRRKSGPKAPADGLYLMSVKY